jgi:hypothetical protein
LQVYHLQFLIFHLVLMQLTRDKKAVLQMRRLSNYLITLKLESNLSKAHKIKN